MLKTSTCCTCGYQWPTGQNGSHQCDIELLGKIEKINELVVKQALKISESEEELAAYKEAAKQIHGEIFCIGGPLNDNIERYTSDQMVIFSRIINHLEF